MKDLEELILKYLESRPADWTWIKGTEVFTRDKTIELFKKSEEFRKRIVEEVLKLATDLFLRQGET